MFCLLHIKQKFVDAHISKDLFSTKFLILDIFSLKILNCVSCFLLDIEKMIQKYLDFFLKRDLESQNS